MDLYDNTGRKVGYINDNNSGFGLIGLVIIGFCIFKLYSCKKEMEQDAENHKREVVQWKINKDNSKIEIHYQFNSGYNFYPNLELKCYGSS